MSSDSTLGDEERLRYLEYFQKALIREGTESFLLEQKQWFQLNRSRLAAEYAALISSTCENDVPALANPILTHQDRTEHDSVFAQQIFSPIMSKALDALTKLGYSLRRPVVLANAPSVEPSPAGVPSTDCHMLFIGQGTSSFCNYWGKVFSAVIYKAEIASQQEQSETSVLESIRADPAMIHALRLTVRYARSESLMGFGELKQEPHLLPFRMLLVSAMETFVVGHELGHFILHERYPESNGTPPGQTPKQVELLCDAIGFAVCSAVGEADDNEVSRHLIGPLFLLYALKLCDDVQTILLDIESPMSDTHPGLVERIQSLFKFAKTTDPSGLLATSIEEALGYAMIVGSHVKSILVSVRADSGSIA